VLVTTALTGDGVPELLKAIDEHAGNATLTARARAARAESQVWAVLGDRLRAQLDSGARGDEAARIFEAVADHRLDPFGAADQLLASLERRQ
jgi:LAO/AO transport system kinase